MSKKNVENKENLGHGIKGETGSNLKNSKRNNTKNSTSNVKNPMK